MNFISLLLFSISTNLDNIPIGISYFLNNKKMFFKDIFKISFFTSLITFIIMYLGENIRNYFPLNTANIIGATILILIGINGILKEFFHNSNSNILTNNFSYIKTILLLSINNLATGFSASITGINYFISTIFTFIFSIIFLCLGLFISRKIQRNQNTDFYNYLSYVIIIILGIIEFII